MTVEFDSRISSNKQKSFYSLAKMKRKQWVGDDLSCRGRDTTSFPGRKREEKREGERERKGEREENEGEGASMFIGQPKNTDHGVSRERMIRVKR